jgi:hypothetical protein
MSDEGIYTINIDGTDAVQITSGGIVPTWQPTLPSENSSTIVVPNVPNTAVSKNHDYSEFILPICLVGIIILAAIIVRFKIITKTK